MRFKNWVISGFNREAAVALCRERINPLVSVLLASRDMTDPESALRFIYDDSWSELCDPFLMADIEKAAARIKAAINNKERVAIYGDYDVDGITSSVMLAGYLRRHGVTCEIYIPDRLDEGYGLNHSAIGALKERGTELIITVDCGITAIGEAQYAKSLGMGLIITDHHECKQALPEADAVVDPKRPDCMYPNKALAGVGVVFKIICALERDTDIRVLLDRYSDLTAIGTIADVMPITGENRAIVKHGLSRFNSSPRIGPARLLRQLGAPGMTITTATVGFGLAPRLNAAGRMGQTALSVDLLLTEDEQEAERLAAALCRLNDERREIETEIMEQAEEALAQEPPNGPIVLAGENWHQGVMGIVAAKTAERRLLPTIMISLGEDGIGRGSCRSFGGFNLYAALSSCGDLLISYGGHEMAAGITVSRENVPELRRRLCEFYEDSRDRLCEPSLTLDFIAEKPELLTIQNIEALDCLRPFGAGNPPPRLCITDAVLVSVTPVGAGKHSRLRLDKNGRAFDAIFFSMPAGELGVCAGMTVDIAFEPQINEFRGRKDVQLLLFDIRPAGREPENML